MTPPTTETPGLPRHQRERRDTSYDDVLVVPRYLAGSSWSCMDAFVPLTHHYWHDMSDELGNFYVTTSGSQLRVAFVPEISELMPDATALWQIRAREGWPPQEVWSAAFTDETPPEIIAEVTAELDAVVSADEGQELYTDRGIRHDDDPAQVWEVFRAANWHVDAAGFVGQALSPDELVRVAYRTSRRANRDEAWLATIGRPGGGKRPLWEATFHSATPTRLLHAFATALTDPAPVTRESGALNDSCRPYATPLNPPAPVPERPVVPTPLEVARRRGRNVPVRQAVSVPRWSTSTSTSTQRAETPSSAAVGGRHR